MYVYLVSKLKVTHNYFTIVFYLGAGVNFVMWFNITHTFPLFLSGKNSPVKLKLGLPIFNKDDCFNKYKPLGAELSEKQLCAGGAYAQDSCKGDSGGPLMRKLAAGIWEAVGVVSFGNGCGRDGWPGVYSSVASYNDWIKSTMRSSNN